LEKNNKIEEGISLIVSCYNDGNLLTYFLESVLEQEEINFSFELIVIDNSSTDNTSEVFNQFVENFRKKNINYHYFIENKRGLNHARNRGLAESKYSYTGFTDADAKLHPYYISNLKKTIDLRKPIILCGPYEPWYNTPRPIWFKDCYNQKYYGDKERFLNIGETPSGINMIFNKSVLKEMHGFGTEIVYTGNNDRGEETELFYRYTDKFHSNFIFYSPDLLVYHYTRPQLMRLRNRVKAVWGIGKTQAGYRRNPGIMRNIKNVLWVMKELSKDFSKYYLGYYRNEYNYLENFLVEKIIPKIFDLSLSLSFMRKSV